MMTTLRTAVPADGGPGAAGGPVLLRLTLLGPLRAEDATGRERPIRGRKSRALLGHVALAGGRAVPRTRLAALLWDRVPEAQARASLRQALTELAQALPGGRGGVLRADHDGVRLDVARCAVDVLGLENATDEALAALRPGELMEGLEGLSDAFDEWLLPERRHLAARLHALQEARLARLAGTPGAAAAALGAAESLLALDVADEGAWRAIIRLSAEAGDRARALRAFAECRDALRRTLDVEPSAETAALAARLRAPARRAPPEPEVVAPDPGRRPRVGVLPFTAAGPGESEVLARAYADDAALELARFRRFDIIAPLSLGALREDRSPDACAALGLDYLVDGALRGEGGSRSLMMSLLDVGEHARPLWSDRVPLSPLDAAAVERGALLTLVARMDPVIQFAAGTRRDPGPCLDATRAVLRAIPLLYSLQRDRFEHAGALLAGAVVREPENAMAAAWAAQWHVFAIGQGWTQDPGGALEEAGRLAALAMRLDPENAEATGIYGHVCSFLHKDFDSGAYYLDRSLEMNPYQASTWAMSAPTHCYLGDPAGALERLERYRGLAPCHPHAGLFDHIYTMSHLFAGDYERAAAVGRRAVRANPGFVNGHKSLLAALGHLGQADQARPVLDALLRLEPGFGVRRFVRDYPFHRPEDRDRYEEGLRLAGAPAG